MFDFPLMVNFGDLKTQKIYTTGFTGKRVENLAALLNELEALLIDIRLSPPQMPLGWSETYLRLLLKNRYLHIPSLGSRSFKEGKPSIQNIRLGMNLIKSFEINVLLICECREYKTCHRKIIAEEFTKENYQTLEIENWK